MHWSADSTAGTATAPRFVATPVAVTASVATLRPAGDDAAARARAQGWAAGRAEALLAAEQAERARREEHQRLLARLDGDARAARERALAALTAAAGDRAAEDAALAADVVDLVLTLAADLASALVECTDPRLRAEAAARRAVQAAGDEPGTLVVRLHPDDVAALGGPAAVPGAELVADPSQRPGSALAARGARSVDATVATALAAALGALRGADTDPAEGTLR
jgi:flagellar assembly protein FliH